MYLKYSKKGSYNKKKTCIEYITYEKKGNIWTIIKKPM